MKMPKIYIDPGHSTIDPGAVGYETEFRLAEAVSKHQEEYLRTHYVCEVKVCDSSTDSMAAICREANEWGADLFVSNHFNAGGGDGYEGLVHNKNRVEMAKIFVKYVAAAGQNLRSSNVAPGVKLRPDLYVLRNTDMPAILNEGAFVDNLKDIQDWNDEAELKELGIAYAKASAEYLGLEEPPRESVQERYTLEQFIREVQEATGSAVDGFAGNETIGNTVTVSTRKNRTHAVVAPMQKRLAALGYDVVGEPDGIAGPKFEAAMIAFQKDNRCWQDGEATARNKTWRKLLGME